MNKTTNTTQLSDAIFDYGASGPKGQPGYSLHVHNGDRVKISSSAPEIYTTGPFCMFKNASCIVEETNGRGLCRIRIADHPNIKQVIYVGCLVRDRDAVICTAVSDDEEITYDKDGFWEKYTAQLVKEIALKVVDSKMTAMPSSVAEYAVRLAKVIVKELKND